MRLPVWRDLALIVAGGLALRLLFIGEPGHIVDLNTFGQWALAAADHPWSAAYEATDANYPPGALLFFELIGRLYRAFVSVDPGGTTLRTALKVPNVVFDLLGALIAYAIARRFVPHERALVAAAFIAFNPAIVYDSSLWGQNDSITAVTALGALGLLLGGNRLWAWIALAFAILNKPPVLVLAPLFALEAFTIADAAQRRRALRATAAGVAAAVVFAYAIAVPFYTDRTPWSVYARMLSWYSIGSSLYPYTSANGFNLYALIGDFYIPDTLRIAFVPIKDWAYLLYAALAIAVLARYARRPGAAALLTTAFILMLGFFMLLTEMHERYLIYALVIMAPLAARDARWRWLGIALTITEWLNLEYALTYMWINSDKPAGVNPNLFAPVLARLCALVNLGVLAVAVAERFGIDLDRVRTGTIARSS